MIHSIFCSFNFTLLSYLNASNWGCYTVSWIPRLTAMNYMLVVHHFPVSLQANIFLDTCIIYTPLCDCFFWMSKCQDVYGVEKNKTKQNKSKHPNDPASKLRSNYGYFLNLASKPLLPQFQISLFHLLFESGLLHPRVSGVRKFLQVHGLHLQCNGSILGPMWTLLPGLFGASSIFRTFFFRPVLFVVLQIWHKD